MSGDDLSAQLRYAMREEAQADALYREAHKVLCATADAEKAAWIACSEAHARTEEIIKTMRAQEAGEP